MKITYNTKANGPNPKNIRTQEWWEEDANEVKEVVNTNDTIEVGMAYPIPMDKIQGRSFGTWSQPMTGNITVDTTNWVEGACAVVIWSGDTNPEIIGATVQSYSGEITEQKVYSIYLHYLNNRLNVNVFNVNGSVAPSNNYLLDIYTDAVGAYSLRKLKSTATLAIEIRRNSDDQITNVLLEDVGSITVNSTVSAGGTLANWAGTDNVFVRTWYDQSGNGNDAVEDTFDEQPAIMYSGALQERNLKPSIDFHFADVGLLKAPRLLSANTWSINGVIYNDEAPTNAQAVLSQHTGAADVDRVIFTQIANTDLKQRFNFNNGASISGFYSTDWVTVGQTLFSNYASANNYYWKDNGGAYETLVTGESLTPLNTNFNIGAYGDGSQANNFKGHMQEIIVWDSDKSSDRVSIENNINDFYNVY